MFCEKENNIRSTNIQFLELYLACISFNYYNCFLWRTPRKQFCSHSENIRAQSPPIRCVCIPVWKVVRFRRAKDTFPPHNDTQLNTQRTTIATAIPTKAARKPPTKQTERRYKWARQSAISGRQNANNKHRVDVHVCRRYMAFLPKVLHCTQHEPTLHSTNTINVGVLLALRLSSIPRQSKRFT